MVINKVKKIKLQNAYEQILKRFDNESIKYETENNIIQPYNPNILGPDGLPLPEPDPNTVGTGSAWIKYFYDDRKQGYIFLCCHLIDCETCHYDRFITVYNYTDDMIDTNLQGMQAITAIEPFPETGLLSSTTLYYKSITKELTFNDDQVLYTDDVTTTQYDEGLLPVSRQEVKTSITIYQFFADFSRDSRGNLIPLTKYNSDLVAIDKLSDIAKTDNADDKLFVIAEFNDNIKEKKITKYKFYQTSYQNPQNKYIEVNVIKYIPNMYDDLNGLTDQGQRYHVTDSSYYSILSTVTNYTRHCQIKTFVDITNIDPVWNFIAYKDKNLPIVPLSDYMSLGSSQTYFDYSLTDASKNTVVVTPVNSLKLATNYDTLDSTVLMANYYNSLISNIELPINDTQYDYELNINSDNTHNSKFVRVSKDFKLNLSQCLNYTCKIKVKLTLSLSGLPSNFDGESIYTLAVTRYAYNPESDIYDIIDVDFEDPILSIKPELTQMADGHYEYVWPTTVENEIAFTTETELTNDVIIGFTLQIPGSIAVYDKLFLTANIICLTNVAKADLDSTYRLFPVTYNLNTLQEGVFRYYQPAYGSFINSYLFYPYTYVENVNKPLIDLTKIDTYDLNISSNNTYYNIVNKQQLKSIYKKLDTREKYSVCPTCNADDKIGCNYCKNKRYIQDYKILNFNIRYNCPECNPNGIKQLVNNITHRCRRCAGTGDEIEYLFYNCYEFKNLSTYTINNTPEKTDLTILPTVDDIKNLKINITLKGENETWPYLNYLLYKIFEINAGSEIDSLYDKYYNWIIYNLVFYKFNGTLIKYYYWNGKAHDEVLYGYNYIYSIKTYTADEWTTAQKTALDNKVLYKVLPDIKFLNDYIGFYAYNMNGKFTRIYFDKEYVYKHILESQNFKDFNLFVEESSIIANDNHHHNIETGITGENTDLNERYVYKYTAISPITGQNICFESSPDILLKESY